MNGELAEGQISSLREWWVGRAYARSVAHSSQTAAVENELRERIARGPLGVAVSSGERAPRMLLAFLLEGQGKESLARSEWQSMVTPREPKAASLPAPQPSVYAKTGF